ncbi:MAG: tetratricopeptide repeat protein [Holophagaceae bacterium]|nr:tetratricopeptide repeat protein [Holophagaceae bacterium]
MTSLPPHPICIPCSRVLPDDSSFCEYCGKIVTYTRKYCFSCQWPLLPDSYYCEKCGERNPFPPRVPSKKRDNNTSRVWVSALIGFVSGAILFSLVWSARKPVPPEPQATRGQANNAGDAGNSNTGTANQTQAQNTANAFSHIALAVEHHDNGDYNNAKAEYKLALEIDPNNQAAKKGLENAERAIRRQAEESRRAADESERERQRLSDEAERERQRFAEASAYFSQGLEYLNNKEWDNAIREYDKSIRLDPNDSGAYNNRGNGYLGKNFHDQAIADYNKALELNPNNQNAKNNLEIAKNAKQRIADEAERERQRRADASSHLTRGNEYYAKGDYNSALAQYNMSISLNATKEAYYNRGLSLNNLQNYDAAITSFNNALQLDPNYTLAREARERAERARQNR